MIAELLLKRTTATAVARVYQCFLDRFPSLQAIDLTHEEELVGALSGVGLQRQRARALKRLASWILTKHGEEPPRDLDRLLEVPGLGRYSAAAILTFGYDLPVAILDANVERILSRVFRNSLPARPPENLLAEIAQNLLPREGYQEYNYGLLDLGRQVCRYVDPKCAACPLDPVCDYSRGPIDGRARGRSAEGVSDLSSNLRAIRRERGLSLKTLAQVAGLSKLTIIQIESGRTSPRSGTIEKLAQALDLSTEELSGKPPRNFASAD